MRDRTAKRADAELEEDAEHFERRARAPVVAGGRLLRNLFRSGGSSPDQTRMFSGVVKQRHESEIHVQLLMTME